MRAYFSYVPLGLSVRFLNLSTGNPTSFVWGFGVTGIDPSTEAEPIVSYAQSGVYEVTLTISDGVTTEAVTLSVGVTNLFTSPALPVQILDAVMSRLPTPVLPTVPVIDGFIKKWQIYLADLIDPNIATPDTFDQYKWPALVNDLIINLCLYDIITDKVMSASAASAVASGTGSGALKKVVTGPAEAEWFSSAESAYSMMKAGGLYDQIKQRICILAHKLRIPLGLCESLSWKVLAPTVSKMAEAPSPSYDPSRNNQYQDLSTNPLNIHD